MKEVTFMLPVHNKENKIGLILKKIRDEYPDSKIIVIDNNSSDKTSQIATDYGALVLHEKKYGKYHAVKKGFKYVKTQFTVLLEAEDIQYPQEIKKLIGKLLRDNKDIAIGSKLNKMISITKFDLINYHLFHLISSLLYYKTSDVFTGYWAFNKDFIHYFIQKDIKSTGFEGEAEAFSVISEGNFKMVEVPIKCQSNSIKLNTPNNSWKIYKTISGLIKSH